MISQWKLKRKISRENIKSKKIQKEIQSHLNLFSFNLNTLKEFKRSEILFILGSGSSICDLNERQWQEIRRNDSLGINHWLIHPHVPNFYTCEVPRLENHREVMMCNLKKRAKDYKNTAFLFKGGSDFDEKFAKTLKEITASGNRSMFIPTYFTVSDESQFIYLLKKYDQITQKMRINMPDALFRKRASVVFSTMLGYDLNFKNIVFCGVDGIAGSGYFYEHPKQRFADGTIIPENTGQKKGAIHKTMDPKLNQLTAEKCLQLINSHLFKKKGVRMWVGTKNSILSKWLPDWKWDL